MYVNVVDKKCISALLTVEIQIHVRTVGRYQEKDTIFAVNT